MIVILITIFIFWVIVLHKLKEYFQNCVDTWRDARMLLNRMSIQLQMGETVQVKTLFQFLRKQPRQPLTLRQYLSFLPWLIKHWQNNGLSLFELLKSINDTMPHTFFFVQKKFDSMIMGLVLWCFVQFISLLGIATFICVNQSDWVAPLKSLPALNFTFTFFVFLQFLAGLVLLSEFFKPQPLLINLTNEFIPYWGSLFVSNKLELGYFMNHKKWLELTIFKKRNNYSSSESALAWHTKVNELCASSKEKLPLLNLVRSEMKLNWENVEREYAQRNSSFRSSCYWLFLVLGWAHFLCVLSLTIS